MCSIFVRKVQHVSYLFDSCCFVFDLFKIYPEWSGMVSGPSQTLWKTWKCCFVYVSLYIILLLLPIELLIELPIGAMYTIGSYMSLLFPCGSNRPCYSLVDPIGPIIAYYCPGSLVASILDMICVQSSLPDGPLSEV